MANQAVAIFGGGVAGLTAAHELVKRGYTVDLYDAEAKIGGKSANQFDDPDGKLPKGAGGRNDMPGEHGFRFFPGFYRHLIDSMAEIPNAGGGFVADDLTPSREGGMVFGGGQILKFPRRLHGPSWDLLGRLRAVYGTLPFTAEDLARMAWFRLKYLTTCPQRRLDEYEEMSWWQFIDGDSDRYSHAFKLFEASIPRTMSALVARTTSAKVVGDIGMQFLLGINRPWEVPDRVLNGPSSEVWLNLWRDHLVNLGVVFHQGTLQSFDFDEPGKRIKSARVNGYDIAADNYVAAVPVERIKYLISDAMARVDPELRAVRTAAPGFEGFMVGAQFGLKEDQPMVNGHMFYPETEWALTSISQAQFWNRKIEVAYGDGGTKGILSVIIADGNTKSTVLGKTVLECADRAEVLDETLRQLRHALRDTNVDLSAANITYKFLDNRVVWLPGQVVNETPLLIHPVGGHADRPGASGQIENLYLASDYVRTNTQLASMEAANEAAKRAVNAILDRDGYPLQCDIWELQEEPMFAPAKSLDERRFNRGRPHVMEEFPIDLALDAPALVSWIQPLLQSTGLLEALP